jgi:hypothetical protein
MDNNLNHILTNVLRIIKSINEVDFKSIDVSDVRQYISDHIKKYKEHSISDITVVLASEINEVLRSSSTVGELDLHEYFNKNIGLAESTNTVHPALLTNEDNPPIDSTIDNSVNVSSLIGLTNPYEIVRMINPSNLYKTAYLNFDSRYASKISSDRTKFTWNFLDNTNVQFGSVNTPNKIRDIISMKLMKTSIPSSYATSKNLMNILIHELVGQAFIGPTGRRFHFIGAAKSLSEGSFTSPRTIITFDEDSNGGVFTFMKPITSFDKLTFSIAPMYKELSFINDTFYNCTIDLSSFPTSFVIDTGVVHNLASIARTGGGLNPFLNLVYISGFNTTTPKLDSHNINYINNVDGFRQVEITSPTTLLFITFFLGITSADFPAFNGTATGNIRLYISDLRIFFNLEVTYLDPAFNTNTIE